MKDFVAGLRALYAPLERRIRALASACTITDVDDSGALQSVALTLLSGERLRQALRVQPYGLSAHPPAGSVGLAISVGGTRTHVLVLGGEDASRPKSLPAGACELYDSAGNYVRLTADGNIEIKASTKVTVTTPELHVTGNVTCAGDVSDHNGSMQEMREIYNGHNHGGVQGGSSNTAAPNQEMT
ncbi:MAG: phage baseplate assembly protein [Sinobacteraceae bacterium]|nr:phage baseplate assembly protein [Nevskiaceae bacterium]